MSSNYETIKTEILRRAKEANACIKQYSRAYRAETMQQLCQVIKDNFWWACNHDVLTVGLLEQYKSEFAENEIYVNTSVERGFLLCGSATALHTTLSSANFQAMHSTASARPTPSTSRIPTSNSSSNENP